MATLYFNDSPDVGGANDSDWYSIANWWLDDQFLTTANAFPTSSDSVVVFTTININTDPNPPTVVNLTVEGTASFAIVITVTGAATFNGSSQNYGEIYGSATFNHNSYNWYTILSGNATFNDYSGADATCEGVMTANDYAYIYYSDAYGILPTSAVFNDYSTHGNGGVSNNNILNDYAFANGQGNLVGDSFTFNDNSYGIVDSMYDFNLSGNPVILPQGVFYVSGNFGLEIVRRSGINGSSVLGVI